MDVLGQKPKRRREEHLSPDTKSLLMQRSTVKRRDPTSDANKSEYSRLNKMVKKSCKADDNNWALRVAADLEAAAKCGHQLDVWQKIKYLSNKRARKSTSVRDKDGKLISEPNAQKERWKEYFEKLPNPPPTEVNLADLDNIPPQPYFDCLSEDDGAPSRTEISNAIKRLKNYKSPGIDSISNEQLKYGEDGLLEHLHILCEKIWSAEQIPNDWVKGLIIPVGKKGDTSHCSNNRGITLRSTASKLLL